MSNKLEVLIHTTKDEHLKQLAIAIAERIENVWQELQERVSDLENKVSSEK